MFFLLFAGTLSFGLAHIFFSKYDVASKMIIGILLGIISIVSHNVFHAIIIHAVYNLIVGRKNYGFYQDRRGGRRIRDP